MRMFSSVKVDENVLLSEIGWESFTKTSLSLIMSIVYVSSCNQILLYCINYSSTRFVSLLFSVLLDHTLREVSILLNSTLIQRTYVLGQEVRVMRRYVFLQNFPFSLEFELFSVLLCIFVFLCYHFLFHTFLFFSPLLSFISFPIL